MDDISARLARLNSPQREAVTAPEGPLLVTAGAGSGKTAVLVNRVAWLIGVRNIAPRRIIAVTFTNKAAREMKRRVHDLLEGEMDSPVVGTFHGLCNQFLRIRYQEAGLNQDFRIMDQDDQLAFITNLMKERHLNRSELTPKSVASYINKCKESKKRARENEVRSPRYEMLERVYESYEQECERQGRIDFAELILRTVEVMERNVQVREKIQERYLHVLIDEFQDTNELQYQWMELFGAKHRNITVVGDEDQSIYSWRGALAGNLKRFERSYRDALVIRLEQNYRSTKSILDAANGLIKRNRNRFEKKLWTGKKDGNQIKYYSASDSNAEARFVANQIKQMARSGRHLSEFVVLYRTNAQSRSFEEVLGAKGIPFRVYGGLRFYLRREIKEVLSYLLLITNPAANEALQRAINSPPRGIGNATKQAIAEHAAARDISHWAATGELEQSGGSWTKLRPFVDLINELKTLSKTQSLSQLVETTISRSGIRLYYQLHKDSAEQERVENLDELINAVTAYEQGREIDASTKILGDFLDSVALDPGDVHNDDPGEKIQLMTLHSVKGLEFPIVFLTGLDESILPHFFSIQNKSPFARQSELEEEALQEERRLCYVGITRAEEQLFLTRASRRMVRGGWESFHRSRFLREIPHHLLEPVGVDVKSGLFERVGKNSKNDNAGRLDWLGKAVRHKQFGFGMVTKVENNGSDCYLTIEFGSVGEKVMMSEYVTKEYES